MKKKLHERAQALAGINEAPNLDPATTQADIKALAKIGVKVIAMATSQRGLGNWLQGTAGKYKVQMKRFDEPSADYGLNKGRVSKLYIADPKAKHHTGTGVVLANYDRGWDIKPTAPAVKKLVAQITKVMK